MSVNHAVQWRALMGRMSRERKARGAAARAAEAEHTAEKPADARPSRRTGRVVPLAMTPERGLERASRTFLQGPGNACDKCGSTFIVREPAFVHCHYCGKMARIANASLSAQELFELRLGLRLAS